MTGSLAIAGAGWAVSSLGWVASPIISKLLNEGFSYLGIDMDDRIEELEAIVLPQFQEVVDAAERSGNNKSMEKWLRRLKAAMYEAEDTLDLYKYRLLQNKMEHGESMLDKLSDMVTSGLSILTLEKVKLENCLQKLEEIALEAQKFCVLLEKQRKRDPGNSIQKPMVTTSKPPKIIGRDGDCDYLIQELLEPVASEPESSTVMSYSIHSIIGVGGSGKTTLAQLVYNDERLTTQFDLRIWLSMIRGLDIDRHTRIMIEAASNNECPRLDSMDILQDVLIDFIKLKKIFVVMDDVWWDGTMNEVDWDLFVPPFASVKRGSRILVTSRSEKMPSALLPQKIMPLKDLDEDTFLTLFMHHAFRRIDINCSPSLLRLERIGKEIAKKLSRSPLAAKTVGCRLYKKMNERFWQDTLENDVLHDTMQSLLWSYQNLDAPIQRCFSYCGIFPKGYLFRMQDMVQLWVAEGFINESGTRKMEDVGEEYFQELLSVFFFQSVDADTDNYSMHDLFHDLAERVSKDDSLRIENGQILEIPPGIYHISVMAESLNECSLYVDKLRNLRTMIFLETLNDDFVNSFLRNLEKFKKLRVLSFFKYSGVNEVPVTIGELVHLRYLDLSNTRVRALPESVGKLYNLQTLKHGLSTNNLPKGLNKLINLRHFKCFTGVIPGIGKLTSLQTLSEFTVKKEKGYEIGELMYLDQIEGSIHIYDLQNVKVEMAAEAKLVNKKRITNLRLHWGDAAAAAAAAAANNSNSHLGVLEHLRPHQNLERMEIIGYKASTYPSWMSEPGYLENLVSLSLYRCPFLETLPTISTLFPYLNTLHIHLPKLTQLPTCPPSLKNLKIGGCESLVFNSKEELQSGSYAMELDSHDSHHRVDAPEEDNIRMYAHSKRNKYSLILPPALEILIIAKCYITEKALSYCLIQVTCLKSLLIENITTITALPPEEVLCQMAALTYLGIIGCNSLISIAGIRALLSLEKLIVSSCPCLKMPSEGRGTFPPSLVTLTIGNSNAIEQIEVRNMPSISSVEFVNCRQLKSIVLTNVKSLNGLVIINCHGLFELICSGMHFIEKLEVLASLSEETCSTSGMLALPSLKKLCTSSFWMISKLLDKGQLTMLEDFHISSFFGVFSEYQFEGLNSLRYLKLSSFNLQVLPSATKKLSLLMSIVLTECQKLSSLPDLPKNLKYLTIECCPCIVSLPDLPKSLVEIKIIGCPKLMKRCQEPDGEDWPKISHVRRRVIMSACNG